MRILKKWMFAAILACGVMTVPTSCTVNDDNPSSSSSSRDIPEGADPSDYEPSDINVALLGSLKSSADHEVIMYWFENVTTQVDDETTVVITDQITEDNKADIAKVLNHYGLLLLMEPSEDNVKKYAEELGIDPNADYSNLEILGLSGFGDQFVSYLDGDSEAVNDPVALNSGNIWDVAPMESLGMKAFVQWAEDVDKKYDEWQKYLAELMKDEIPEDDAEEDAAAGTRGTPATAAEAGHLDINKLPGVDRCAQLKAEPRFASYNNSEGIRHYDNCYLSVTCNYHLIPVYQFSQLDNTGADYYIVKTTVNWDLSKTLKGYVEDYWSGPVNRDSYRFFPHQCEFYTEPVVANNAYAVQIITTEKGGDVFPESMPHKTSKSNTRSFDINGNVSGGADGGISAEGPFASANLEAGIGVGAGWSTTEEYEVDEWSIGKISDGAKAGHSISIPKEYRPTMGTDGRKFDTKTNFNKTISVNESWVYKATGTNKDSHDPAFKLKFYAKPTVGWYSYYRVALGMDCEESSHEFSTIVDIPAPNRQDIGFLKIVANTVEGGKNLKIFGFKAIDKENPKRVFEKNKYTRFGDKLSIALPAGRTYNLELKMGSVLTKAKTYKCENYKVVGGFNVEDIDSDAMFE